MKNKVLIIGLSPEYYSMSVKTALLQGRENLYSTNMGACFITRSLMNIFNADYVDFNSVEPNSELKNKYDVCVVSLASHIGPNRNLSKLLAFIKELDIRTVFLSGGLDAGVTGDIKYSLHESVLDLLRICTADNQYIGVRGALSALVLHKCGFKNVAAIGCPTMYSSKALGVEEKKLNTNTSIAVPFHWTIAANMLANLKDHLLIGQDCIDEEVFVNKSFDASVIKKISNATGVSEKKVSHALFSENSRNSYFPKTYEDWFDVIGSQTGLLSGRLHAAICGLRQGVPSVLVPWDYRTSELIDYFALPTVDSNVVRSAGPIAAFHSADFANYNALQPLVWSRWREFLTKVDLLKYLRADVMPDIGISGIGSIEISSSLLSTASVYLEKPKNFKAMPFVVSQIKSRIKHLLA